MAKNMCDGCLRKMPMKDGTHVNPNSKFDMIACTAHLYLEGKALTEHELMVSINMLEELAVEVPGTLATIKTRRVIRNLKFILENL